MCKDRFICHRCPTVEAYGIGHGPEHRICDRSTASLILKTHWVMVAMDQFTRRIIGFAVPPGTVDGPALGRMFNQVIAGAPALPQHLSSDHDPPFEFHRWRANLRILEVNEIKTVPHIPLSHPFVERVIGTVRRELLDHVPFLGAISCLRPRNAQVWDRYRYRYGHRSPLRTARCSAQIV